MPKKKRASLSSILIPPFLLYPLPSLSDVTASTRPRSSTRTRSPSSTQASEPIPTPNPQLSEAASSLSSRNSPPPDFLLDDDPFANYTGARPLQPYLESSTSPPRSRPPSLSRRTSVKQPRSPLATEPSSPVMSPSSSPPPVHSRLASSPTRSPSSLPVSGRQLRPAYTRPAFAARPSLPSLHTLSQTDFIYPIKVGYLLFSSTSSVVHKFLRHEKGHWGRVFPSSHGMSALSTIALSKKRRRLMTLITIQTISILSTRSARNHSSV
jgi:hypothetical protein